MPERYPGYDVLNKRNSQSWNEQTRRVLDARLAIDPNQHCFFTEEEWPTIRASVRSDCAADRGAATARAARRHGR